MNTGYFKIFSEFLLILLILFLLWAAEKKIEGSNNNRLPEVTIETVPVFIYTPALGFYVATGIPYDLFYINNYKIPSASRSYQKA